MHDEALFVFKWRKMMFWGGALQSHIAFCFSGCSFLRIIFEAIPLSQMEQNIVVNGEYTETDPLNVHNKFTKSSQQYIKIKPLCLNQSLRGKLSS